MTKYITIVGVCIIALGLATGGASARDFIHADENKDGGVSWEEAFGDSPALTRALFDAADSSHDGKLDQAEYDSLFALTCSTAQ